MITVLILTSFSTYSQENKDSVKSKLPQDTMKISPVPEISTGKDTINLQNKSVTNINPSNEVQVKKDSLSIQSKPTYNPKFKNYKLNRMYVKATKDYEKKEYNAAMAVLDSVIHAQPTDSLLLPLLYLSRGNNKIKVGDPASAIEDYNLALQINPSFSIALSNRGVAKHILGKDAEAVEDLAKAISIKPDYAEAYYNRGISYFSLKKYSEAISDFSKALKFKPDYLEALNNRSVAKFHYGDIAGACDDLNKAVALGDSDALELINDQCK
ncbi:MAG: tetratricopeptide repeat protein [Bacteroidota bacterium]|nr:tetratricopeptide repeat protein [Bacteroidota bacterium]